MHELVSENFYTSSFQTLKINEHTVRNHTIMKNWFLLLILCIMEWELLWYKVRLHLLPRIFVYASAEMLINFSWCDILHQSKCYNFTHLIHHLCVSFLHIFYMYIHFLFSKLTDKRSLWVHTAVLHKFSFHITRMKANMKKASG